MRAAAEAVALAWNCSWSAGPITPMSGRVMHPHRIAQRWGPAEPYSPPSAPGFSAMS